jgi:hypothetical protein
MKYHIAKNGADQNCGTSENPFLTINRAARIAQPGDEIIVHEGVYRECVNPLFKGLSNRRRIIYRAAEGEQVTIKGSEIVDSWERVQGTVWKTRIVNSFFGDYNPYEKTVRGDWIVSEEVRHLGDVYLNGMSFYEANNLEELYDPEIKTELLDNWTGKMSPVVNEEQTKYQWFGEVDPIYTTIYANFHQADPRKELVEINVRKACFHPEQTGIDYLTVQGFEMAHAATPWTPPTADQPGLISANWSKGWIIENNIIHDSKCSAISIGKEASTGNNYKTERKDKAGYNYQLESVFTAHRAGWSREKIGSHIIRNNTIYNCGQNGIVGHLGCVFSEIYDNHIYNISTKREFYGHEIAGIKLHAPIDVVIRNNHIHDCSLGIWLDWQTQGTRISRNLFHDNNRDLFIEVSHGPFIVDHNILTADYALDNHAQGGAYINNLICGRMNLKKQLDRATQYHLPHSTDVAGFAVTYCGDDRYYNNIFIGNDEVEEVGTDHFNGYTTSLEEFIQLATDLNQDHMRYSEVEEPVYINKNVYLNGARAFDRESENLLMPEFDPGVKVIKNDDGIYLEITLPEEISGLDFPVLETSSLARTRISDQEFENPDGSDVVLDCDFFGHCGDNRYAGPIANLKPGKNLIQLKQVGVHSSADALLKLS